VAQSGTISQGEARTPVDSTFSHFDVTEELERLLSGVTFPHNPISGNRGIGYRIPMVQVDCTETARSESSFSIILANNCRLSGTAMM